MRRDSRPDSPSVIAAKCAEGRGAGHGTAYLPWIFVNEFRNRGEFFEEIGIRHERTFHLFSHLERRGYFLAERADNVSEYRENFPVLPVDESWEIAKQLGVPHPMAKGYPRVMTLDALVTVELEHTSTLVVRSYKRSEDLDRPLVYERQVLERAVCTQRSIPWSNLTEKELPTVLEKNLREMLKWRGRPHHPLDGPRQQEYLRRLAEQDYREPIAALLARVAESMKLSIEYATWQFRWLAWKSEIPIDLYVLLRMDLPHLALRGLAQRFEK